MKLYYIVYGKYKMTQEELNFLITKLKCCSASLSIDIGKNLVNGACDDSIKLIMLNSFIEELLKYNLGSSSKDAIVDDGVVTPGPRPKNLKTLEETRQSDVLDLDTINCLTTEEFAIVVQNAKDICGKCDCNDD
jgi:hypothetical protein